jgi:poly-gamma-glutamate capsule biosynthesis protein CapA/YwtB (metallophosphatase superfamily)
MKRRTGVLVAASMTVTSCALGPAETTRLDAVSEVVVNVVGEDGAPLAGAQYDYEGGSATADSDGRLEFEIAAPVAGVVTLAGKLPEPLVVAPRDRELGLVMYDRFGAGGERTSMHFGGDVMLARRYQEPGRAGTALATDAASARSVVSDLAPLAAAADLTVVNAETVIGRLEPSDAYPAKRFLLQSPPFIIDMLEALGVDLVTLGNNHAYDWRDPGVTATINALDAAAMPWTGAGLDPIDAVRGTIVAAGERDVGVVSATTVNGDFVNDQLPILGDPVPASILPAEAWQYDTRNFTFGEPGSPGYIAPLERRAGDAWHEYDLLEPTIAPARAAEAWAALTAPDAFPELQDWVARRGHGGAAAHNREAIAAEIDRLRADGADIVVVQFHGGFQFSEVKSTFLRKISHRAIDDGADFVISHHPHVLQGVEWYEGALIAYSLGNLVFDQDFLSTFPTALLRLVVDGSGVIDARFVPVMLVDYRPVPIAGDAAERVVRLLHTRSALPAESERIVGFEVGSVLIDDEAPGVETAAVDFERNSGAIRRRRPDASVSLTAGPLASATLPPCLALRADGLPNGIEYGVDLFDWGGFDDVTADGSRGSPMHWVVPSSISSWSLVQGNSPDPSDDALELISDANRRIFARFVARVSIAEHRLYDTDSGRPADTAPTYTLEFDARRSRGENALARIDVYDVDDADPTSDPTSTLFRSVEVPLEIDESEEWSRHVVPLDDEIFAPDGDLTADAAMVTLIVEPAFRGRFTFDDVRMMEWRGAPLTELPLWAEVDALRADVVQSFDVSVSGCESV